MANEVCGMQTVDLRAASIPFKYRVRSIDGLEATAFGDSISTRRLACLVDSYGYARDDHADSSEDDEVA